MNTNSTPGEDTEKQLDEGPGTPENQTTGLNEPELLQMDVQIKVIRSRIVLQTEDPKIKGVLVRLFDDLVDQLALDAHMERKLYWVLKQFENQPDVQDKIMISLLVPQVGAHHTEGPSMYYHLELMVRNLEEISNNRFDETLDPRGHEIIKDIVTVQNQNGESIVNPELLKYVFLHDIAKADCMTIKSVREEEVPGKKGKTKKKKITDGVKEITFDEWLQIENSKTDDGSYLIPNDEGKELPVTDISYYHGSAGGAGRHGSVGANAHLMGVDGVSADMRVAIENHELAFLFDSKAANKYEEKFGKFTEEQQKFIIAVCYLDNVSSHKANGKPDLTNVNNLIVARANYRLIQRFEAWAAENDKKLTSKFQKLGALKQDLTEKDLLATIEKPIDVEKLVQLMTENGYTEVQIQAVKDNIETNMGAVNKAIGPKNMAEFMKLKGQCTLKPSLEGFEV